MRPIYELRKVFHTAPGPATGCAIRNRASVGILQVGAVASRVERPVEGYPGSDEPQCPGTYGRMGPWAWRLFRVCGVWVTGIVLDLTVL